MRRGIVVFIALLGSDASLTSAPWPSQAAPSPKRDAGGFCILPLAEFCKEGGGICPTWAESVEGLKANCGQPPFSGVRVERCVGTYRSISHRGLGSSDVYFDLNGRLIAASVRSDVRTSDASECLSAKYGKIPTCTTRYVPIDVCKKK